MSLCLILHKSKNEIFGLNLCHIEVYCVLLNVQAIGSMLLVLKKKFIGTTSRALTVDVSVVNLIVKLERGNYEDIKVLIK